MGVDSLPALVRYAIKTGLVEWEAKLLLVLLVELS